MTTTLLVCWCKHIYTKEPCQQVQREHGSQQGKGKLPDLAPWVLLGPLLEGSNAPRSHQTGKITLLRLSWCPLRSTVTRALTLKLCLNPCSTSPGPAKSRIWPHSRLLYIDLLCYSFIFTPLKIHRLGMSNFMSISDENNLAWAQ